MATQKYTVEQITRALEESKGLISPAARALKCHPQTVRNYIKRHPTLEQAKNDEREKMIDVAEDALYKQIVNGDTTAIIFTLKTVGRDRGYVERREFKHQGDKDNPVEVNVSARDELASRISGIAVRRAEGEGDSASLGGPG